MRPPLRVLELFCGIGGCAAAVGERAEVVAAVDINRAALEVYAANFPHPTVARTLESVSAAALRSWEADLWWLSPPCQPYTVRGRQRDLDDPRADSFKTVVRRLGEVRPRYVALENVAGFCGSRAHALLRETLDRCGYRTVETLLCPTQLGICNRRPRFYLVASLGSLSPPSGRRGRRRPLVEYLDPAPPREVYVAARELETYASAIDVVRADDPHAVTSCFTAAYGRSPVRSGSYLLTDRGLRRFTPTEILRLLGFGAAFRLPPSLTFRQAWPLVGNSLAVAAVRALLSLIPELRDLGEHAPAEACDA